MTLELASLTTIRQFTQDLAAADLPPLGALVCKAGVQVVTDTTATTDGFEMTFGVNHLGHFLRAHLLLPRCVPRGRIIVVSSDTHDPAARTGMPAPAYPSAEQLARAAPVPAGVKVGALGRQRYTTSKRCNVLCAYEFARRLHARQSAITVNALNPGLMLDTGLVCDYSKGEMMSEIECSKNKKVQKVLSWLPRSVPSSGLDRPYFVEADKPSERHKMRRVMHRLR